MKNRKAYTIAALTGVGLLLSASLASAAVDKVRCILWQGDPAKFHTAVSGESAQLNGVITTDSTATIWYKWVYGDGTESAVTALSGSTLYKVASSHVYTGTPDTPFTAKLMVDSDDNSMANAVSDNYLIKLQDGTLLDTRVNIAIDKGLWWLYTNNVTHSYFQTFDGSPFMVWNQTSYSTFYASPTASAIQAFAINNHKITGNFDEDPYAEAVRLGMNWLVQGYYYNNTYPMLRTLSVAVQHGDNPEEGQLAPNGYGIEVKDYNPSYQRSIYQGGQIMDAIIASGVQPGDSTGRDFTGRGWSWTYGELLQDMADMYAYGQYDGGSPILGGWRYNWGDFPDNSAAQWAAIGMIPAQKTPWNCKVPQWVKTYNINWLNYSHQSYYVGSLNVGGFGYTGSGTGYGTSPSGLVQMAFDGQVGYDDPATPADERDIKWIRTENYFGYYWSNFLASNNTYGWYAFAKAMRLAVPKPVERLTYNNIDWYQGLASRIVAVQNTSGAWTMGNYTNYPLTTAWMVITLRPALFHAAPIACFTADPNPTYPDALITFDPSCSDHSESDKNISNLVSFDWDWNNDGVYDESTASADAVTHSFSCASLPCTYPVTLRVTDDAEPDGLTATYTMNVNITNPPHPPTAKAGGPYMASLCAADSLTLNGSASFDPNEGDHEDGCPLCENDTITAWDWDLTPPLTGFNDVSGEIVNVAPGDYLGSGAHSIGLRVTDNTAAAYPGSGDPNLTDTDFATVHVSDDCLCTLSARSKLSKVQLTWANTGAASYDIYRSTTGPNSGFSLIADDHVTSYATYLDSGVTVGTRYWYRVVDSNGCGSVAVIIVPSTR